MHSIGVSSAGWYHHDSPLESIKYIQSCGFDAMDFDLNSFINTAKMAKEGISPNFFDQSIEEILASLQPLRDACRETGFFLSQIHAPYPIRFEGNDELNRYLLSVADKSFAIAEFLGCPAVVIHPNAASTKALEWETNLALYRDMIPLIKKYKGVKCCLENLFTRLPGGRVIEGRLTCIDEICSLHDQLNKEAGGDYFGICFDVGHAILTGRDVKEYVKQLGNRLTILHIHDNNGITDLHIAPYSCVANTKKHTICDWNGFVEGLRTIGYRGVLSFETDLIFAVYPPAVYTEVLKLISAIGRYWSEEIEK